MGFPRLRLRFGLPAMLIAIALLALAVMPISRAWTQQRAVRGLAPSTTASFGIPLGRAEVSPYLSVEAPACGGVWTSDSLWHHMRHTAHRLYPNRFDLGSATVVSDLESLRSLEEFSIDQCVVPAGALAKVRWERLPELRILWVGQTPLSLTDWQALRRMPKLEALIVEDAQLCDEAIKVIGSLENLTALRLNNCGLTDDSLAHLQGLTRLEGLGLRGNDLSDPGLRHLTPLKRLTVLDIGGDGRAPTLTPQGLVTLRTRNARITGDAATILVELPELQDLRLSWTSFDDAGVSRLGQLRQLMSLELDGAAISERSLPCFPQFENLFTVSMSATPVAMPRIQAFQREHSDWSFDYGSLSRARPD